MAVNEKTELTVQQYKALQVPSDANTDPKVLVTYLTKEILRLSATLQSLTIASPQATDVAPLHPQNGMIRYAEGAWATALGATGLYVYKAGVWTHIV